MAKDHIAIDFSCAGKSKSHTTMYEVNDSGSLREFEYHGDSYIPSFITFIESLGYDVKQSYPGASKILIKGVEMDIDVDHASYMSKNSYTRERSERKQQNRYIRVTSGFMDAPSIIKIFFNKEYDQAKLISKIEAYIKSVEEKRIAHDQYLQRNINNTIAIGKHYCHTADLRAAISQICIEKGTITFYLAAVGMIQIAASGALIEASFKPRPITKPSDFITLDESIGDNFATFKKTFAAIIACKSISADLQAWAEKMYHGYFYTETMSTEKS